ncbi:MAG: PfkB family carbohydrate kinase [Anaerolineales bacterium]
MKGKRTPRKDNAEAKDFQLVVLGELLIDMIPGEVGVPLKEVRSFHPMPGGAPANVAVAASRLGARSAFIGKVGQDHFGTYLAEVLAGEGVDITGLRFDSQARTTLALVALPDPDSAEFVFYRNPGADQRLTPSELDHSLLESGRVFHFGTVSLTDEPCRGTVWEAVGIARRAGAIISCDINYRAALWRSPEQALQEMGRILPGVDLLKVNEFEASLLTGKAGLGPDDLSLVELAARELVERGPRLVVITLGAAGSYFQLQDGGGFVPAYPVKSVDTVGCGDAFMAGLLTQIGTGELWEDLLEESRIKEAVSFANAVGALTSLHPGAIPAMPSRKTVEEFISAHGELK